MTTAIRTSDIDDSKFPNRRETKPSTLSFSHEPQSIYDFSEIVDTDEHSSFTLDADKYAEIIKQKFLEPKTYILTSKDVNRIRNPISKESTFRRHIHNHNHLKNSESSKQIHSVLNKAILHHRSGSFLADQFLISDLKVYKKPELSTPGDSSLVIVDKDSVREEKNVLNNKSLTVKEMLKNIQPKDDYVPDRTLLFNYFLMIRQFTTMSDVLLHLIRSFIHDIPPPPPPQPTTTTRTNSRQLTSLSNVHKFIYIMNFWIVTFPYDFRCPAVLQRLREFLALCLNRQTDSFADVRFLLRTLYKKLTKLEQFEDYLDRQNKIFYSEEGVDISTICPQPSKLAEQLYIVEVDFIRHIGPEEYVQYLNTQRRHSRRYSSLKRAGLLKQQASNDNASLQLSLDDRTRNQDQWSTNSVNINNNPTPKQSYKFTFNLEAYIRWVNRLSYYVTSEIVRQRRRKCRAFKIEYFIETAERCLQLNNFNSTMGIISGIDDLAIKRMTRTWAKVSQNHRTKFKYFQSLMSVSNNFATYRSAVNKACKSDFCIPFLCVALKDVYFINEVMSDYCDNGKVNIEKVEKMGDLIKEFSRLGNTSTLRFTRLNDVIQFLNTSPVFDSSTLMEMSIGFESDDE